MKRPSMFVACLLLPLALAGCGTQEIYGHLKESQANDMIAVLRDADISAGKSSDKDGQWSVTVSPDRFSDAIQVLRANGLPRDDFASLGSIFEKKGLVSSPTEERARLIYGLSQELSRTVSEIDGVVQARVHLAMPEADPLSDRVKPASAAVFVKYQPGFDLRGQTGAIKSLVTNSIEGLAYDKVSVVMVPSQMRPREHGMVIAGLDATGARVGLAALGIGGLGLLFLRRRPKRGLPVAREEQPS